MIIIGINPIANPTNICEGLCAFKYKRADATNPAATMPISKKGEMPNPNFIDKINSPPITPLIPAM